MMVSGKRSVAEKIVYGALDIVSTKQTTDEPLPVLEQALDNGALGVLRKPFDIEDLVEKLDAVQSGLIVVADGDPGFVDTVVPALKDHGYVVATARNGQEAIDLVSTTNVDLLVLDLNLPGMSGLDVLKVLQALPETWSTPVIALTAAAGPRDVERGLAAGFFRYVTKPLDVNGFLEAVEAALDSKNAVVEPPEAAADGLNDAPNCRDAAG